MERRPFIVWRHLLSRNEVNLWRMPLFLSLIATVLFGITASIDALNARGAIHLPAWISNGGIDDARSILSSEMGAVSTVLALIFSVALLVLSMVATLFGFRLLYRFVQDWVTQVTIGLFLATFIYILLAYVVTRSDSQGVFIPQLTLLMASVLVVVSFGFLVYYSHRIAVSIQNPDMIAGIVVDLEKALKYELKFDRGKSLDVAAAVSSAQGRDQNREAGLLHSVQSGYLQELDHSAMLAAATRANAQIELVFRPGQFIQTGDVLARVYPPSTASTLQQPVIDAIGIGSHRVLTQDPEFGLYQIVEIAIRALSPAVNDTFTGIACIDCIGDALRILLTSPPYDGCWYDKSGQLRVAVPQLKFERLVKVAFDQIRQASVDTPAVLIRMLSTIERLAHLLRNDTERQAMLDQAAAVWEASSGDRLVTHDRTDLENAWLKTSAALGANVHDAKILT
jgi:uncharacterized membrane protein